jgi:hypothetical protein
MNQVSASALSLNSAQTAALHALNRALSRATEVALFDELAALFHPDVINHFCDAVTQVAQEARTDTELSNWTVKYGTGMNFTCQAEDIHHAIEQCVIAYPGENIITAFEGQNESQVEVEHWDSPSYGGEGTDGAGGELFVVGAMDRREVSGQFDVTMAPADGDVADLLYAMFEVSRLPGSRDDTQCLHIHFDSENLAMSVFKQGNKFILRPENGVTVLNTTLTNGEQALIVQ